MAASGNSFVTLLESKDYGSFNEDNEEKMLPTLNFKGSMKADFMVPFLPESPPVRYGDCSREWPIARFPSDIFQGLARSHTYENDWSINMFMFCGAPLRLSGNLKQALCYQQTGCIKNDCLAGVGSWALDCFAPVLCCPCYTTLCMCICTAGIPGVIVDYVKKRTGSPQDQTMSDDLDRMLEYFNKKDLKQLLLAADTPKKRNLLIAHQAQDLARLIINYSKEDVPIEYRLHFLDQLRVRGINLIGVRPPGSDIQNPDILCLAINARYTNSEKVLEFILKTLQVAFVISNDDILRQSELTQLPIHEAIKKIVIMKKYGLFKTNEGIEEIWNTHNAIKIVAINGLPRRSANRFFGDPSPAHFDVNAFKIVFDFLDGKERIKDQVPTVGMAL